VRRRAKSLKVMSCIDGTNKEDSEEHDEKHYAEPPEQKAISLGAAKVVATIKVKRDKIKPKASQLVEPPGPLEPPKPPAPPEEEGAPRKNLLGQIAEYGKYGFANNQQEWLIDYDINILKYFGIYELLDEAALKQVKELWKKGWENKLLISSDEMYAYDRDRKYAKDYEYGKDYIYNGIKRTTKKYVDKGGNEIKVFVKFYHFCFQNVWRREFHTYGKVQKLQVSRKPQRPDQWQDITNKNFENMKRGHTFTETEVLSVEDKNFFQTCYHTGYCEDPPELFFTK